MIRLAQLQNQKAQNFDKNTLGQLRMLVFHPIDFWWTKIVHSYKIAAELMHEGSCVSLTTKIQCIQVEKYAVRMTTVCREGGLLIWMDTTLTKVNEKAEFQSKVPEEESIFNFVVWHDKEGHFQILAYYPISLNLRNMAATKCGLWAIDEP